MAHPIVACDPSPGAEGIAVNGCFFGPAALVTHAMSRATVACQDFSSPLRGSGGQPRNDARENPVAVLTDLATRDGDPSFCQAQVFSPCDRIDQHIGASWVPPKGPAVMWNVLLSGNLLAGPAVVTETQAPWQDNAACNSPQRLLVAAAKERFLNWRKATPTGEEPCGKAVHSLFEAGIAQSKPRRAAQGIVPQSRATPPT